MSTEYHKAHALWRQDEFSSMTAPFKIGAMLSDGQWYTLDKIGHYTGESDPMTVRSIVEDMVGSGQAVQGPTGTSYRMTLDQLKRWRRGNGVPMDAQIIPRLIYPRIFGHGNGEMTEVEMFLNAPAHPVAMFTFLPKDDAIVDGMRRDLGYLGKFRRMGDGRWKIYSLSNQVTKKAVLNWNEGNGGHNLVPGRFVSTSSAHHREIVEMDQDAVSDFLAFYVPFSKILVPSIMKTFDVYIGGLFGSTGRSRSRDTSAEGDSILIQWIIELMQSYNETNCVPFSASISRGLPKKVYDYSSGVVGEDMNRFQIAKNKAIKSLMAERRRSGDPAMDYFDDEIIRDRMNANDYAITRSRYEDLNDSLKRWQKSSSHTPLEWDENGEERGFHRHSAGALEAPSSVRTMEDIQRSSDIQLAIMDAAVRTEDWRSAVVMLRLLSDSSLATVLMDDVAGMIPASFKNALARSLAGIVRS